MPNGFAPSAGRPTRDRAIELHEVRAFWGNEQKCRKGRVPTVQLYDLISPSKIGTPKDAHYMYGIAGDASIFNYNQHITKAQYVRALDYQADERHT